MRTAQAGLLHPLGGGDAAVLRDPAQQRQVRGRGREHHQRMLVGVNVQAGQGVERVRTAEHAEARRPVGVLREEMAHQRLDAGRLATDRPRFHGAAASLLVQNQHVVADAQEPAGELAPVAGHAAAGFVDAQARAGEPELAAGLLHALQRGRPARVVAARQLQPRAFHPGRVSRQDQQAQGPREKARERAHGFSSRATCARTADPWRRAP